jgi:predicted esterase
VVSHITAAGFPHQRILLLGFSQGACLVLDYAARHPRRYGAVIALSGGLIGATNELPVTPGSHGGLDGTPVFLGCSDVDPHIPLERVHHTARALQALGGQVDERIYPNLGHTVNQDELIAVQSLMQSVLPTSTVTS